MNPKYKGIDLERIKQVQEVRFPHVRVDPPEVKLALSYISSNDSMTAVQFALQDKIEAYQRKCVEDHDMFIICEMAKLFLEEKQKQKKVLERLEEYRDDFMNDIYDELRDDTDNLRANRIIYRFEKAIEIIKEEVQHD